MFSVGLLDSLSVVNTITFERLNVGRRNLAVRCIVHKSRLSSNLGSKVKGQGHQGQKTTKCGIFFRSDPCGSSPQGTCVWYMFGKTSLA